MSTMRIAEDQGSAPSILLLNRWDDEFAEYHRYFDHDAFRVAYVTTHAGKSRLPADRVVHIECLDHFEDYEAILGAAARCVAQLGKVDRIVALSEFDLLSAARLREHFGAQGLGVEQVLRFVDKTSMKAAVLDHGLRAPHFVLAEDEAGVRRLVREFGFPLIFKPRRGAASAGVRRLSSIEDLRDVLAGGDLEAAEIEEFVQGDIVHIDGFLVSDEPVFLSVSRYVNTCYDFAQGIPLGSVLMDPSPQRDAIRTFALQCVEALGFHAGVFHLELIIEPSGRLCFLEIGARLGGGEIPFLTKEVFGIDLVREWLRLELGLSIREHWPATHEGGGFLLVPEPRDVPCQVQFRPSLLGKIPYLYAEILPDVGEVFDGKGGYAHIGGRFRFRGGSQAEITRAIVGAMREYEIVCAPARSLGESVG